MEILGIGPLEFIFIFLIILIVLGPKDMAGAGRTIGRFLRKVVTSQWWHGFRNMSREIRQLPTTLMREASIEEAAKNLTEINNIGKSIANTPMPPETTTFSGWVENNPPDVSFTKTTEVVEN